MYKVENRNKVELFVVLLETIAAVFIMKFILGKVETNGIWELLVSSVLFFFVMPIITIKYIFKRTIGEYNLRKDISWPKGIILLLATIFLSGVLALAVVKFGWINFLEVTNWSGAGSKYLIIFLDLIVLPGIIFSQDFFLRGFVMKTISRRWGFWAAVAVQMLVAVAIKGYFDGNWAWQRMIIFAWMNLILGVVAYHSRWIIFSTLLRWLYFLIFDLFIIYKFHIK